MARLITVGTIIEKARQRADQENSDLVSEPEAIGYVEDSYLHLYDILVSKNEDYYTEFTADQTITSDELSLPDNFYKLVGVDVKDAGEYRTLKPYMQNERNELSGITPFPWNNSYMRYRLIKDKVKFIGKDNYSDTVRILYIPTPDELTSTVDEVDGVNGWEQYIIVDVARKMAMKEESYTKGFEAELMKIEQRIEAMAEERDNSQSARVQDVSRDRYFYSEY